MIARFTQEDVYRGDGLNLYAYCDNNPVMYYDPSGYAKHLKDAVGASKPNAGLSNRGYRPQAGERTFEGYVNKNLPRDVETKLYTKSTKFNNNPKNDGHFKRFGTEPNQHGISGSHVHQPMRTTNPNNGVTTGKPGAKTKNSGVTTPSMKDTKQLYEFLNNEKYQK